LALETETLLVVASPSPTVKSSVASSVPPSA
jgi:hypothetical protein